MRTARRAKASRSFTTFWLKCKVVQQRHRAAPNPPSLSAKASQTSATCWLAIAFVRQCRSERCQDAPISGCVANVHNIMDSTLTLHYFAALPRKRFRQCASRPCQESAFAHAAARGFCAACFQWRCAFHQGNCWKPLGTVWKPFGNRRQKIGNRSICIMKIYIAYLCLRDVRFPMFCRRFPNGFQTVSNGFQCLLDGFQASGSQMIMVQRFGRIWFRASSSRFPRSPN